MPFTHLLCPERIEAVPDGLDRDGVLERAAALLASPVDDHGLPGGELADRLREREALASTGLGHGVAIPHARVGGLDRARGAFLRLAAPVPFAAPDGNPVDLVFAMAVPESEVAGHLAQLAEIAERFADADFRASLREADDSRELAQRLLGH
ncbi:PTS sugar transporter subunit IIA [Lysobacter humi (ex Lee et al. 2017)]